MAITRHGERASAGEPVRVGPPEGGSGRARSVLEGRRRRRWWLVPVVLVLALGVVVGGVFGWAALSTDNSFVARAIVWGDSDVGDIDRFPKRAVRAASVSFAFERPPEGVAGLPFSTVPVLVDGAPVERDLDTFLEETVTSAFLVVRGGELLYERYFNGYGPESQLYTFSVAKSFVSALVGIAVAEGLIESVDDPVTEYVPELVEHDPRFAQITLRDLLAMSSGLRSEERFGPWGDDAQTYYDPNLRRVALEESEIVGPAGEEFLYNDFNPLLIGLVLERVTGGSVASYLEEKLWRPLGMEADGSWSLDSDRHGFEKMATGVNGRAVDFAKFGVLYRDGGLWQGEQLVPRAWVEASTARTSEGDPSLDYQYGWWTHAGAAGEAFMARGIYGQYIYVAPDADTVIVRFGSNAGYGEDLDAQQGTWPALFAEIAARLSADAAAPVVPGEPSEPSGAAADSQLSAQVIAGDGWALVVSEREGDLCGQIVPTGAAFDASFCGVSHAELERRGAAVGFAANPAGSGTIAFGLVPDGAAKVRLDLVDGRRFTPRVTEDPSLAATRAFAILIEGQVAAETLTALSQDGEQLATVDLRALE